MLHVLVNYAYIKLDLLTANLTKNTHQWVESDEPTVECNVHVNGYGGTSVCVVRWMGSNIVCHPAQMCVCMYAYLSCTSNTVAVYIQYVCPCLHDSCLCPCVWLSTGVSRCMRGWWRSPERTGRGVW